MKNQSTRRLSPVRYIEFLVPAGYSIPGDVFEIESEDSLAYYYTDGLDRWCYIEKDREGQEFTVFEEAVVAKPPTTWKSVEAKIAAYWGGKRRGADFKKRTGPGGKNDVVDVPGWSIEVKHNKRPTWGLMVSAVSQAIGAKEQSDDIPVAVVHKLGDDYGNSLVIMRLSDFADHFINTQKDTAE